MSGYQNRSRATPRPIPEGFRDYALTHKVKETRAHYRLAGETFRDFCVRLGIQDEISRRPKFKVRRIEVPSDFAQWAQLETNDQLAKRYGVGIGVIYRFRSDTGIRSKRGRIDIPEDFERVAPRMSMKQLSERYGVSNTLIGRWCKILCVSCRAAPKSPHLVTQFNSAGVPAVPSSTVDQAAHHLRKKGYQNVYSADRVLTPRQRRERGLKDGHYFVAGHGFIPSSEMIDLAKRHGFNPTAWSTM